LPILSVASALFHLCDVVRLQTKLRSHNSLLLGFIHRSPSSAPLDDEALLPHL
ncbi:uncharacterized protein DEA37_0002014, partial [Paragonimus westermani]